MLRDYKKPLFVIRTATTIKSYNSIIIIYINHNNIIIIVNIINTLTKNESHIFIYRIRKILYTYI